MRQSPRRPWVVLSQVEQRRWGGDLRRTSIMRQLARRTTAVTDQGIDRPAVRRAARSAAGPPWPWRHKPFLGTSELLTPGAVVLARRSTVPVVLDLHDHVIAQADALGRPITSAYRQNQGFRIRANLDLFPLVSVPSATFAELVGLDPRRVVVAPNGTDPHHVVPAPFPSEPAVGFISGAAPGRGVEALIEAVRIVRLSVPETRLTLWLAAVDEVSTAYVAGLRATCAGDTWVSISEVAYGELSGALASVTVLTVPHPAGPYLDAAVPVKLMDSMAAGRPVVVTPRLETRRIVEAADAGLVSADDSPAAIAAAITPLLDDPAEAARLGANGRAAAEHSYAWDIIGDALADAVLGRMDGA